MELLRNLFEGYPNLWGGGVAHSVLILSLVIALGITLSKIKIAGVSLGVTWILFVGIVFGHFNLNLDEHLLHFLKEFGLILFVYSIGLQVGPGFFSAFKKGGFTLNMLAVTATVLSVGITIILHFVTDTPMTTMVGILSGAVTNTPGLGAAQQANSDLTGIDAPEIAMGYAVAYPIGVVGVILTLLALKYLLKVDTHKEETDAEKGVGHLQELTVRPVTLEIKNEAVNGKQSKKSVRW
jgi:putative transport protein